MFPSQFTERSLHEQFAERQQCQPVASDLADHLLTFFRKQYQVPASITLSIVKNTLVPTTCYRQITVHGSGVNSNWRVSLYLSPDHRFLSDDLLDTTVDPVIAEETHSRAVMAGLEEVTGVVQGPGSARVTIVEFSDFQCPYCRALAGILNEIVKTDSQDIRIVFHHMPLAGHDWARAAAKGAACAQLQGSSAFWALHSQLFLHQADITKDNVSWTVRRLAQGTPGLDINTFDACVANEMSLGIVLRDLNLASENNVQATPTLFINGHRVSGVANQADLRKLILAARTGADRHISGPSARLTR